MVRRIRLGSITLNAGADPSGHQSVLFLPQGSLTFYEGATQPKPSTVKRFVSEAESFSNVPEQRVKRRPI
jgi:hypothetical protein